LEGASEDFFLLQLMQINNVTHSLFLKKKINYDPVYLLENIFFLKKWFS
jgi:hypothetical protein